MTATLLLLALALLPGPGATDAPARELRVAGATAPETAEEAKGRSGALSREGKFEQAAQALDAAAQEMGRRWGSNAMYRADLLAGVKEYRARVGLAAAARAGDAKAKRDYLRALCLPASSAVFAHPPVGEDVQQLLAELRKADPAADRFFSRKVKVVPAAPPDLDPGDVQLIVDAVVLSLRNLGMTADIAAGDDLFTVTVAIPAPRELSEREIGVTGLINAQAQVAGRLTSQGEIVLGGMDFSGVAAGFNLEGARRKAATSAAGKAQFGILRAWLATQP